MPIDLDHTTPGADSEEQDLHADTAIDSDKGLELGYSRLPW